MRFSKPVNMGIVACPGAEVFADDIILNLKKNYTKKHKQKAELISRLYGMEKEEVDKQVNFMIDVEDADLNILGDVEKYRAPEFKIPVKYTRFANGEYKSEINASVRGMDVFVRSSYSCLIRPYY
jgi:ribose-phosphate pyrophosphokinase